MYTFDEELFLALAEHRVSISELAHEFEVSMITIQRWAQGNIEPHPRIQKLVLDYIRNK